VKVLGLVATLINQLDHSSHFHFHVVVIDFFALSVQHKPGQVHSPLVIGDLLALGWSLGKGHLFVDRTLVLLKLHQDGGDLLRIE
jgi:glycine cleavage system pyridoxal-binding protein P